ncbi:NUDIX hydrolase [Fibrella forsythiae]|uniref:GDP-mannose pyrophosphatase n=1 Tax=Fibrella forsythiae TaxID=2817061 RepID=A0ABS3JVE8_9BACT|nr:NUDIX hydrolase [Fibrella forsythiae]MBO0952892.1 NUDIX hydrolase [Fibrella forsythiae]
MNLLSFSTDPKPWTVEESTFVYAEPWLTVRRDAVRLQNGGYIPDYYTLEYPDWINVVAVTKGGELVLLRQYRHGIKQVAYELCAGCVDPGEQPLEAARRELLEETGYGGGEWRLLMTLSANPGTHTNLTYSYLALGVEKRQEPDLELTEEISVHLVELQELLPLLDGGQVLQSLHMAPLLRYWLMESTLKAR